MINPPTDNLYKFIAISGVVILIMSVGFPFSKATNLSIKEAEITADYIRLLEESKFGDDSGTLFTGNPKKSKEHTDFLNKQTKESNRTLREIEQKERIFKIFKQEIRFYTWVGAVGATFGFAVSLWGFFLWYSRVQKYEDIILKSRTEACNSHDFGEKN